MGDNTEISWTHRTLNLWRGCEMVSSGCANCYMFTAQRRYGQDPAQVVRTKTWSSALKWQRQAEAGDPRRLVFTCSWSDFFIEQADQWRSEAWELLGRCPDLTFQILTKRPERIADHLPAEWPRHNVWLGVSVENRKQGLPRIDVLREIPAALRFLSIEPLLEDLGQIDLTGIGWVIVGGESGPGHRPMRLEWAKSIRDQCRAAGVPFWFKQVSGPRPGMRPHALGPGCQRLPGAAVIGHHEAVRITFASEGGFASDGGPLDVGGNRGSDA